MRSISSSTTHLNKPPSDRSNFVRVTDTRVEHISELNLYRNFDNVDIRDLAPDIALSLKTCYDGTTSSLPRTARISNMSRDGHHVRFDPLNIGTLSSGSDTLVLSNGIDNGVLDLSGTKDAELRSISKVKQDSSH